MKAYQVRIELKYSNPLLWRRIVLPAGLSFKRLHDIIQNATNFQSGYPYGGYHLYEFEIKDLNLRVTSDEEAYDEHRAYKKNPQFFQERLQENEYGRNRLKELQKEIRKPSYTKVDRIFEKCPSFEYTYDFGDYWQFTIFLEKVILDYQHPYPMLIEGEADAPPEDVGGIGGFEEFIEVIKDPQHPNYEEYTSWAEGQGFEPFDLNKVNERLKRLNYKKVK